MIVGSIFREVFFSVTSVLNLSDKKHLKRKNIIMSYLLFLYFKVPPHSIKLINIYGDTDVEMELDIILF